MPAPPEATKDSHAADLAGLDALDAPVAPAPSWLSRAWTATWPRLVAIATTIIAWEVIVELGWQPTYVLPAPAVVFGRLWSDLADGALVRAAVVTLGRAALGYGIAVAVGLALGLIVARSRIARAAVGSLVTGLQTMPTIAWFPLAILLFGLTETAILFVVVLGAAPAVANGMVAGVDQIPPVLVRAGRVLGASGVQLYRHVILPAALPHVVGGLKQGWAFAWRSLMAGELLVIIAARPSLGVRLQFAREVSDAPGLLAAMIVILAIGIAVDSLGFATAETAIRRRWGFRSD